VPTLERQVEAVLKEKYSKPGNVYMGIPHRLDRPVSVALSSPGIRKPRPAGRAVRERQVKKLYWALVERFPTH